MQLSVDTFKHIIRTCRSRETSADPEGRSEENPSHMHCFNTAVLLFRTLGLSVYKERLILDTGKNAGHCYNKDHDGKEVRLCDDQLRYYVVKQIKSQKELTEEQIEFIFAISPPTKHQYEILEKKFQTEIEKNLDLRCLEIKN